MGGERERDSLPIKHTQTRFQAQAALCRHQPYIFAELKLLLRERPKVQSCYQVTGSDHYLAKSQVIYCSGHLEQLIDRFIPYATIIFYCAF